MRELAAQVRRAVAAAWCVAAAECTRTVDVPLPELAGAERQVAAKIGSARDAVLQHPDAAAAWGYLGTVLDAHEFLDTALVCYRRAERLDPSDFRWPYLAGVIVANDAPGDAVALFERAAAVRSQYAPIRWNLASALVRAGRDEDGRRAYEAALDVQPTCRKALLGLGELTLRQGALRESVRYLRRAADLHFYDREVHSLLARVYRALGDKERAAVEARLVTAYHEVAAVDDPVRAAVADEAVSAYGYYRRGVTLLDQRAYARAERAFRHVIALRSDPYAGDLLNLGQALAGLGRLDEAVAAFESGLAIDPDDPELHNTYGVVLADAGRLDDAMRHFQAAVRIDPRSDAARFNIAAALQRQGRLDDAIQAYRETIAINQAHAKAHARLGNLLALRRDIDAAMSHWRHAITYDHNHYEATLRLAFAYADRGRFDETNRILRWGVKRAPDNPLMLAGLASLLATCPEPEYRNGFEAVRLARRLLKRVGRRHVPSLNLLAAALAETGEFGAAVEASHEAIALARAARDDAAIADVRERLAYYERGMPYRTLAKPTTIAERSPNPVPPLRP
ncbi:MAG: tetratricopeptide repeat protein [Phycisphaerae bacterium]